MAPRKPRISEAQRRWLEDLAEGRDPTDRLNGRSQFGGAAGTVASLWRRGWIDSNGITEAGRAAIGRARSQRTAC
jgi:hypothetical protein